MKDLFEFLEAFGLVRHAPKDCMTGPVLVHNIELDDARLLLFNKEHHALFDRFRKEYPTPSMNQAQWFFPIVLKEIFKATSAIDQVIKAMSVN